MKKLIINPKNEKGIIAELVGENGLLIEKRRQDHHPVKIFIRGNDFDVIANCTLTGEPVHIECIDGKINTEDLIIEERDDNGEKVNKEEPGSKGNTEPEGAGSSGEGGDEE